MDKLQLNLAVIPGPGPKDATAPPAADAPSARLEAAGTGHMAPPTLVGVSRELLERMPVPLLITP